MSDLKPGETSARPAAITLATLAELIGLSKSTVSKALAGYPDVSPATKERVQAAAERYGYRPSSYAQSIKTGLMKSVALVLSVSKDTLQSASLADFLDGVSSALGQEQWTLTVATAADTQTDIDLQRRLIREKKVDGFIIPRLKHDDPRVELMRDTGTPCVIYGRPSAGSPLPYYDIASEECMAQAVGRLYALGHRRIGFLGPNAEYVMTALRASGYRSGLQACGLDADPELLREGAMTQADGFAAALDLLRLKQPPTAILCGMDEAALGAYQAAQCLGLEVGRHVSLIGYDGISEGGYVSPGLTSYANDSRKAGEMLAKLLMRRIQGEDPSGLQVLAQATLVERGSDGVPVWTSDELAAHVAKTGSNREDNTCLLQ